MISVHVAVLCIQLAIPLGQSQQERDCNLRGGINSAYGNCMEGVTIDGHHFKSLKKMARHYGYSMSERVPMGKLSQQQKSSWLSCFQHNGESVVCFDTGDGDVVNYW